MPNVDIQSGYSDLSAPWARDCIQRVANTTAAAPASRAIKSIIIPRENLMAVLQSQGGRRGEGVQFGHGWPGVALLTGGEIVVPSPVKHGGCKFWLAAVVGRKVNHLSYQVAWITCQ